MSRFFRRNFSKKNPQRESLQKATSSLESQTNTPPKQYKLDRESGAICDLCLNLPWHKLQPEDCPAYPHQLTRHALELSAQHCTLCQLVLKAAISNFEHRKGRRNGRGHWSSFRNADWHEQNRSPREVLFRVALGACMPAQGTTYSAVQEGGSSYIAGSGQFDENGEHFEEPPVLALDELSLDPPLDTQDLPVWLYANFWAYKQPAFENDGMCLNLMGIGARFGQGPRIFDSVSSNEETANLQGSTIGVCTNDDTIFSDMPGRLRELSSDSDLAFRRLKAWITKCSLSHSSCKPPAMNARLPSRLLDVTKTSLIVSLAETRGQQGRYIALSHCWGRSPRLMLTKSSRKQLTSGIAISELPRIFREAIAITKKLGIRYIWIDCLCIVQDDAADWEREAAQMGQVYRNAHLTISAVSSADSSTGCFPYRESDDYVSPATTSMGYDNVRRTRGGLNYTLSYHHPQGSVGYMHFFEEWLPGSMLAQPQRTEIGSFGKFFDPVAGCPLSKRGWTLQERFLSPRTIHYAHDQMYYECDSGIFSEDGFTFPKSPYSFPRLLATQCISFEDHGLSTEPSVSFRVGRTAGPRKGVRGQGGWLSLVEDYSVRALTKAEDKLPALAGLARLIAQQTGDEYFAGIWASHIYEDLCWRVQLQEEHTTTIDTRGIQIPGKGKVLGAVSVPHKYRAPTWSWAALDAPVRFLPLSYGSLVARVRDCSVKPLSADKYSRVTSGQLDIEAPLFEIRPFTPRGRPDRHGIPVYVDLGDERGKALGGVFLDSGKTDLKFPCYAMFLDPAHAIVVRSNGKMSDMIKKTMSLADRAQVEDDGKLMDTITVREMIAGNARLKNMSLKPMFDVERIGLADFIKNYGPLDEEGFPIAPAEEKTPRMSEDDEKLEKPDIDDICHVVGSESWGPVTKEDARVWLTVV